MRDGFRKESTSQNVMQHDDFAMLHIMEFYDGHQTYVMPLRLFHPLTFKYSRSQI
jgi:hypothetical protein